MRSDGGRLAGDRCEAHSAAGGRQPSCDALGGAPRSSGRRQCRGRGGDGMNIGVAETFGSSPNRDGNYIKDFAATAESLGFDSLWVPEHIVFFDDYESRYPYNETGALALGRNPGVFDPFPTLTAAAL